MSLLEEAAEVVLLSSTNHVSFWSAGAGGANEQNQYGKVNQNRIFLSFFDWLIDWIINWLIDWWHFSLVVEVGHLNLKAW